MASSSQPTVNQEISKSTSPDAVDHSTKAENLPPKNLEGSDNANMSDPQSSVNQGISKSTTEVENLPPKNVKGSENANMLDQQPSVNQEISKSTTEAEKKNVKGSENANILDQKPSVNQETSKSTTEAENLASKNVKGFENANQFGQQTMAGSSQPSVNQETSKSTTEAEKLASKNVNGSENVNELGQQAVSSQPTVNEEGSKPTTVPDRIDRLITEAKKVTGQENANMSKLIVGLEEKRVFFMNWHNNNTTGARALVQTVLEWILQEPFLILKTDSNGKEVASPEVQLKVKLEELNWVVSKLKLEDQLLLDSESKVSPKVSNINDTIIPVVVARLGLAKRYALSQHTPDKKDIINSTGIERSSHSSGDDYKSTVEQAQKLANDLSYIRSFLKNLKDNFNNLSHRLGNLEDNANVFVNALLQHSAFDDLGTGREPEARQLQEKLRVLNKVVIKLKHQISSPNKLSPTDSDADWYKQVIREFDYSQVLEILPVLHVDDRFKKSPAFGDFRAVYESLDVRKKMCCLCFAVIPENEEVKKRFMTHWWVGEGFVSPLVEKDADEIFQELVKKNCIEPVDEKFRSVVNSYKMNPFIRSALIVLAKEAQFFDFDKDKGNPSANCTSSYRACLVDGSNSQELFKSKTDQSKSKNEVLKSKNEPGSDAEKSKNEVKSGAGSDAEKSKNEVKSGAGSDAEKSKNEVKSGAGSDALDPEKVQVIFNVNEPYPDVFELEWFSKLKNVKVLYLGRWQTSAKHHIEVESVEFLKGLKSMKRLRFFSLQGISRITKLPDSVCKLLNLTILDLRACHNLEELPKGIGSLTNLTHLDISECYLLDYMPREIAFLSQLQVLKGFVINDNSSSKSCTLDNLSGLDKLSKLSIYTNKEAFPKTEDVTTLVEFKALQKLTITWGAGAFQPKAEEGKGAPQPKSPQESENGKKKHRGTEAKQPTNKTQPTEIAPFKKLKKLDLKCYPRTTAPSWLRPGSLPELEKLYIRGGNLQNICPVQENDKYWTNVKVLRLKFLSELKMDYKKLRSSFPKLTYFEKFKCPKLTYFPCNENGVVWLQKP